jgi:hypothetical protein
MPFIVPILIYCGVTKVKVYPVCGCIYEQDIYLDPVEQLNDFHLSFAP